MDKIRNRQTQPFFMLPNTLIDGGHLARMGTASAMVYLCLCRHANTEHQCFPSYSKLQEETGMARSTTSIAIANLLELGYVRKLELKRGMANIYEIMEFPELTSTEIELVQKSNQFKNRTTASTKIEPLLVRKSNSKNTKGKRLTEKDQSRGDSPEKDSPDVAEENPTEGDRQNETTPLEQKEETSGSYQKPNSGSNISAARGVSFTAKRKEPQDIVRDLIAELSGDRYEEFIKCAGDYLASTAYWKEQLDRGRKITERVILQRYAKDLKFYATDNDEAIAQKIAPVSTAIQTDVEMYGLDAAIAHKQAQGSELISSFESLVIEYKKDPSIASLPHEEFKARFGMSIHKFFEKLESVA